MANLEIILACDNKIEEIDATESGFGALKRLATLDLSNNNIGSVPAILGNLTNLTYANIIFMECNISNSLIFFKL